MPKERYESRRNHNTPKKCKERIDNLGYLKFLSTSTFTNVINYEEEKEETISIISQKELMESTSSMTASPFQRTSQTHMVDTSIGNVCGRRVFRIDPDEEIKPENIRPIGERIPLEEPIKLQERGNTLNVAAHDPQLWNTVIDLWKGLVVADFIKNYKEIDAETM